MKQKLLLIVAIAMGFSSFAQFSTGTVTLTTGMTLKIDTNSTTVTLTLTGPSNTWLGIGFGGNSMASVSDMFIWNSSANRDYTPSGYSPPSPDASGSQSWTIGSDNVASGVRTVVATRNLVSTGDYTFTNSTSSIPIIFALSNNTFLSQHTGVHTSTTLTRTALDVEDFSLNASAVYPNPSTGNFRVKSKTTLDRINIYSQTGAFMKTVEGDLGANELEINVEELPKGVYLIELQNASEKSWKKIIIN
ncbi:T9SS type A sorting domain-containing protein [Flavobacterium sp.]|jgi:hypothetical protein|uniref:T9SS type A sorting domain-containing protein n=1 Tax=Flavobacterium sp. TaxID=239 RepID=UPI0037C140EE